MLRHLHVGEIVFFSFFLLSKCRCKNIQKLCTLYRKLTEKRIVFLFCIFVYCFEIIPHFHIGKWTSNEEKSQAYIVTFGCARKTMILVFSHLKNYCHWNTEKWTLDHLPPPVIHRMLVSIGSCWYDLCSGCTKHHQNFNEFHLILPLKIQWSGYSRGGSKI